MMRTILIVLRTVFSSSDVDDERTMVDNYNALRECNLKALALEKSIETELKDSISDAYDAMREALCQCENLESSYEFEYRWQYENEYRKILSKSVKLSIKELIKIIDASKDTKCCIISKLYFTREHLEELKKMLLKTSDIFQKGKNRSIEENFKLIKKIKGKISYLEFYIQRYTREFKEKVEKIQKLNNKVKEASISEMEATKEKVSYFLSHMLDLILFKQHYSKDFSELNRNLYFVKPKNFGFELWAKIERILEDTKRTRVYLFFKN